MWHFLCVVQNLCVARTILVKCYEFWAESRTILDKYVINCMEFLVVDGCVVCKILDKF